MTQQVSKEVRKIAEIAAEELFKRFRGRTPEDTTYVCTTVQVPDPARRRRWLSTRRSEPTAPRRLRICLEPGWNSEQRVDHVTGAPVTLHVSPEFTKTDLRHAIENQLTQQPTRQKLTDGHMRG